MKHTPARAALVALVCAPFTIDCASARPPAASIATASGAEAGPRAPSALGSSMVARPTAPAGPLERTVSTVAVRLAERDASDEALLRQAALLFAGLVRVDPRGGVPAELALDRSRPLVAYRGPLDAGATRYAAALHDAADALPDEDAALRAYASGPRGQELEALLSSCPPGGFAYRVVLPTRDARASAEGLASVLTRGGWARAEVPGSLERFFRARSGDALVRATTDEGHVVLDAWVEPFYACQSEADHAGFAARAAERIAVESNQPGPTAVEPGVALSADFDEPEQGRYALASGVHEVFDAVSWRRSGGPEIDPPRLRELMLVGLREANRGSQLVGFDVRRARVTLRTDGPARALTIVTTLGDEGGAQAAPPEASWAAAPAVAATGDAETISAPPGFLRQLGARYAPAQLFERRREARWAGASVGLLGAFATVVSRAADEAWPGEVPAVDPARTPVETRSVVRLRADAEHPVSLVVLDRAVNAQSAACALASAPACPAAQRITDAPRAVGRGFARSFTVGARRVVAVCAARAPLASLRLGAATAAPLAASGVLRPDAHAMVTWGLIPSPVTYSVTRSGGDVTLELRAR